MKLSLTFSPALLLLTVGSAQGSWSDQFVSSEHFGGTAPYRKFAPHPFPGDVPETCTISQVHLHKLIFDPS